MNVLDLFSGIGGFSLGLERAGMRTVAFCEIEPYCRAVLRKHWPGVPIFEDVRALRANDVGPVDVICGGFPCQDISFAGKGAGITGERSGLWSEYARIIGEIRPRYVIVENVAALLGRGIERVLGDLSEIGYDAEWNVISAADVGAPHRRERVWIVAYPNCFTKELQREPGGIYSASYALQGGRARCLGEASLSAWNGGKDALANANNARLEIRLKGNARQQSAAVGGSWWLTEPDVGRVAHGVSFRVDRLRALGNAVVPAIPEIIGRAIMSADA